MLSSQGAVIFFFEMSAIYKGAKFKFQVWMDIYTSLAFAIFKRNFKVRLF